MAEQLGSTPEGLSESDTKVARRVIEAALQGENVDIDALPIGQTREFLSVLLSPEGDAIRAKALQDAIDAEEQGVA